VSVYPNGAAAVATRTHRCPLCTHAFDDGREKCSACPMHTGCATICCPNCGYSFVDRSATVSGVTRAARALRRFLRGPAEGGEPS
jgi:hypothetical protein